MRSNVCKIENGVNDLASILNESERVAGYNGLSDKQAMQLRLLCEEIDGMLPNIIGDFEGSFWIDSEGGVYKINVSIEMPDLNTAKKEELIRISRNKKNAAAVGIAGKIRNAIENFLLSEAPAVPVNTINDPVYLFTGYSDFDYLWSLNGYKTAVKEEEDSEKWDELEKSVIASVADDVIVGVKGKKADIIIVKKFA